MDTLRGKAATAPSIRSNTMNGPVGTANIGSFDIPPSHTLYCNNLNDKISKADLIASLYELFTPYGEVVDIVAKTGASRRGQSFIVFSDIGCATAALRALQGKEVFSKPIRIQYAKKKSDAILKREGKYKIRWTPNSKVTNDTMDGAEIKKTTDGVNAVSSYVTLFVENLPLNITKLGLDALFGQYPGHIESRLVEGRGVAFIDFKSTLKAGVAMDGLQSFEVAPNHPMKVSMANTS